MNKPSVKNEKKLIISCGILKKEIQSLISKNNWSVDAEFLDSTLHIDPDRLLASLIISLAKNRKRNIILILGVCHPMLDDVLSMLTINRIPAQNCIEMLLGKKLFNELLNDGAFFLLEDWANNWDKVLEKTFGKNNKETIQKIFQQNHKYILAIKTPYSDNFEAIAEKCAERVGLPIKYLTIKLDTLEYLISKAIYETDKLNISIEDAKKDGSIREQNERLISLAHEKARLQMVNEMMRQISAVSGLNDAVHKIFESILSFIGGSDISIYYQIDDKLFVDNIYQGVSEIQKIPDEAAERAYKNKLPSQVPHNFNYTKLLRTPKVFESYDWAIPLITGNELIAVISIKNLIMPIEEIKDELDIFFNFAANIIKNHILDYQKLKQAYDQLHNLNQQLLHKEYMLNKTGEMAKVGGWELNLETKEVICTDEVYKIYEIPISEKMDLSKGLSFYPPESRPIIEAALKNLSENGIPFDIEVPFITATGKHIWVRTIGESEIRNGKKFLKGSFQDISDKKNYEIQQQKLIEELNQKIAEIKTLKGLIPICSSCKKIRNDKGSWDQIETYIREHSDAEFTHGICPDCMKKLYPEFINS